MKVRDRRQRQGPRQREAGEQGIETEALKVTDRQTRRGGAKGKEGRNRGAREGCVVSDKATEKENYQKQRKGDVEKGEGVIQTARRQKDCGERAGVP